MQTLWLLPLSLVTIVLPASAESLIKQKSSELKPIAAILAEETTSSKSAFIAAEVDSNPLSGADSESDIVPASRDPIWIAQDTGIVAITAVQLQETATGLEILIASDESLPAELVSTQTTGNALIITIPNAALALSDTAQAEQFSPTEGVALVNVSELPEGDVQIAITGTDAPPQANVSAEAGNIIVGITPGIAVVNTDGDDEIRLVVEGEQEGSDYFVPAATTATRTDTPLDEIPQSIQVIPKEVLEDQQVIRLNDALRNASGVVSSSLDQRGQRFIIRGFNSASILRDGFRQTNGGTGNSGFQELANIEQIEVLKGPAAILAGALEPGGAINLVTERPLPEPFYELALRAGNRDLIEPSIDISGPLTEEGNLLYRLNALYRNEDYHRDFNVPVERFFVAPVISWAINDQADLLLELEYNNETRPTDFGGIPALGDRIADVPFDRITGEPDDDARNESLRLGYQFEYRFSDDWKVRNSFRYIDFDNKFVSNVVARAINEDAGDFFRAWVQNAQPTESYELQTNVVGKFNTGSVEHTLLAGVDLYHQVGQSRQRIDFTTPQPLFNIFEPVYGVPRPAIFQEDPPLISESRTDNVGLYIQDQVALLDNLFLLAGLRYDTISSERERFDLNTVSNRSDDAFTPRLGVVYKPIDEVSLYTSYSTSFSANSGTTRDGETLEPERGEQFELGLRAELLGDRLFANLALFNITKQNVATLDPDSLPGENFSVPTGEQRSRGVELDVVGEVLPGWDIVANYAYTDADITEDNNGQEGNRLFGVPEHNFNLWSNYEIQTGDFAGLGFGLGVNYVSDRFGDNDNSFTLEDYFLTNAAVSYQRDNWQAALNFRNLFDVDYIDSSEGARTIENRPGEGFTIVGSFSIEF
ncbi:MAG: TonB-dependent siderophore receptor [Cyanobacteria bacterium P01_D01_bin.105]